MIDESFRNGTIAKIRVGVTYFTVTDVCFHKKEKQHQTTTFNFLGIPLNSTLHDNLKKKSFSTPATCPALIVTPTADRGMLCILTQRIPLGLEDSFVLMQVSEAW